MGTTLPVPYKLNYKIITTEAIQFLAFWITTPRPSESLVSYHIHYTVS